MSPEVPNRRRWSINKSVDLGAVMGIVSLFLVGLGAWYALKERVAENTKDITYLQGADARIEKSVGEKHRELVELLNARMDRLEKRLDERGR